MDVSIDEFQRLLPFKHKGVANFRVWSHAMIDAWDEAHDWVYEYLVQGDRFFDTLPADIRRRLSQQVPHVFAHLYGESRDPDAPEGCGMNGNIDRGEWLRMSEKYSRHSLEERALVWQEAIALHRLLNHKRARMIELLENLLAHESYVIQRIAKTERKTDLYNIRLILTHWVNVHNEIVAHWTPERVDQMYTFVSDIKEKEFLRSTSHGKVPGVRSGCTEIEAIDEYLDGRGFASVNDSYLSQNLE